jgi:YspA, cpYpsA-related SLOG family
MKLIITGSRSITEHGELARAVAATKIKPTRIIIGNAKGVDTLAENYAAMMKIPCDIVEAPWNKYGKPAGTIRNDEITDQADALLAVWDGKSEGTLSLIRMMNSKQKPVFVHICMPK